MTAIALGLRAHPARVTYALLRAGDGAPQLVSLGALRVPAALHMPEQLAFVRTALFDVMREFHVTCAGIRTTEPTAKTVNIPRVYIEGVVQELLATGAVHRYFAGALARIGSLLGLSPKQLKAYIDDAAGDVVLVTGVQPTNGEQREALLAALAALRIQRSRLSPLVISTPTPEAECL